VNDDIYYKQMVPFKFGQISHFDSYHFRSSSSSGVLTKGAIRRLATEYSDLSESLPIAMGSSVFMRVNETNLRECQLLIIPPDHTPYAYGCFLFDVEFPTDYPNTSPHVNLQTTGGGSVRFNPNLYNCGKVCLSLLGTWQGDNPWNPKTSTFLQVAVSLQSLVFVPSPYYNEPGYEGEMGSPDGTQKSNAYNRRIRMENVRHAMIGQLRSPPNGWADVIKTHFLLVRDLLLKQVDAWWLHDHQSAKTKAPWSQLRKDLVTELLKLDTNWKPQQEPVLPEAGTAFIHKCDDTENASEVYQT